MANLFEKRATEFLRDSDSFLALITPEPLKTFLEPPAAEEKLYDRLTVIVGTPGSGKTTIATVLQFHYVDSLRKNRTRAGYKELVGALTACRALDEEGQPTVLGVRLPLETEYRDYWELPYSNTVKTRLVLALIQARAMLGWIRNVESTVPDLGGRMRFVARPGTEASVAEMGGLEIESVRSRAVEVERAIYSIGAALVPPATESEFPEPARKPYRPFDALETIDILEAGDWIRLKPLVMLDDAHTLHPEQLAALRRDWVRRELRVARWVLTRLDVLSPQDALLIANASVNEPGVQNSRDVTEIAMQKGEDRAAHRRAFRRMAQDMANRYLRQMPEFSTRGHQRLADLLQTEPDSLNPSSIRKLQGQCERIAKSLGVGVERRGKLEAEVSRFVAGSKLVDIGEDVQLAMLLILMSRHANRVPQGSLFDFHDADPPKPVVANAGIAEAARIHLHHEYGRALYFGIDTLCDASSENAEQFLRLAGRLVNFSETRLLRNRNPVLDSKSQHKGLVDEADAILATTFPYSSDVRTMAFSIAELCKSRTLEANASLDGGANAFGIPQSQFDAIPREYPRLARTLKYAVAYNVLTLAQNYKQGGKHWCLIELGGAIVLKFGLTLKRGGFLEGTSRDLSLLLSEEE